MAIIVLGWGSLVFDQEKNKKHGFLIEGGWREDGPFLPIEFARKSKSDFDKEKANRLTLVIDERASPLQVYWAVMEVHDLDMAKELLRSREGGGKKAVSWLDMKKPLAVSKVERAVQAWAEEKKQQMGDSVEGVIWTAIPNNINPPLLENVVIFLDGLDDRSEAESYVRRTPARIRTPIRAALENKYGWKPVDA